MAEEGKALYIEYTKQIFNEPRSPTTCSQSKVAREAETSGNALVVKDRETLEGTADTGPIQVARVNQTTRKRQVCQMWMDARECCAPKVWGGDGKGIETNDGQYSQVCWAQKWSQVRYQRPRPQWWVLDEGHTDTNIVLDEGHTGTKMVLPLTLTNDFESWIIISGIIP